MIMPFYLIAQNEYLFFLLFSVVFPFFSAIDKCKNNGTASISLSCCNKIPKTRQLKHLDCISHDSGG